MKAASTIDIASETEYILTITLLITFLALPLLAFDWPMSALRDDAHPLLDPSSSDRKTACIAAGAVLFLIVLALGCKQLARIVIWAAWTLPRRAWAWARKG